MFGQHTIGDCVSREERVVLQRQFLSTFCQLAPTKVRRRQLFPLRVRSNAEFFLAIARLGRRLPKAREESGEGERQRRQDQSNDDDDGRFHDQHSLRGNGSPETKGSKGRTKRKSGGLSWVGGPTAYWRQYTYVGLCSLVARRSPDEGTARPRRYRTLFAGILATHRTYSISPNLG